jgi:2'-5' RNA ligase
VHPLVPDEGSALVLRVTLPPALEALRLRHVPDGVAGVPAHVTLLYPFADPASIDGPVRATIAAIAGRHAAWSMDLVERCALPDTLYVSVEPERPLRALQAELAGAFPTLPLYGRAFAFTPHVTVVEGRGVADRSVAGDPAWRTLPVTCLADAIELIVRDAGRWRTDHRFPLRSHD